MGCPVMRGACLNGLCVEIARFGSCEGLDPSRGKTVPFLIAMTSDEH